MPASGSIAWLAAGLLALPLAAVEPIVIDGSSTVYPIAVAIGEAYSASSEVPLQIAVSGTTGGLRLFTSGKIPIAGASRPIRPDEVAACARNGVEFIELPVALDGLTVAVGTKNSFIDHLTLAELKRLWKPGSDVRTWAQLRPGWPDTPVALFGPGHDSGTFDFFTEVVVGETRAIRENFTASEDDNVLVQGLVVDPNALGYFGWSYFQQNRGMLRAVAIDDGSGPQLPTRELISTGRYQPLSRPLFFYVSVAALQRSEIRDFLALALNSPALIEGAGYVPLAEPLYVAARQRLADRRTGTVFAGVAPSDALAAFAGTAGTKATAKPAAPAPAAKPAAASAAMPIARATAPARTPATPTKAAPTAPIAPAPATPAPAPTPATRPEASPEQLERLRAAAFALTRATLEREPDPVELERRAAAVREALAALPGPAGSTP